MIIKSLSRKDASFAQLAKYIERGAADGIDRLYQHLYARHIDPVVARFEANGGCMRKRTNGVMLYHEVISITRAQALDVATQKKLLFDIADRYIQTRAPQCLVFGALHEDKAHSLHFHLMISANIKDTGKRHRLTKAEFLKIQRDCEQRVLDQHPELEQSRVIGKPSRAKQSSKAYWQERRTGELPGRSSFAERLAQVFTMALNEADLDRLAKEARVEL